MVAVATILVVDDEPRIVQLVRDYLEHGGFTVLVASDGQTALRSARTGRPDLVVLDLGLPGLNGLDVTRALRRDGHVPIIMLTARTEESDKLVGLELGADDYIIKPFSLRELFARVRAVLRRQEMGRAARASDPERGGYRFNGWTLERRGRKLIDANGAPVPLSKGDYALLLAFLEAPQRALTREHLLQATRVHEDVFDRSIDVQVLRLRRKLEVDPGAPRVIRTERGIGYVFALPVEPF